MLKHAVGLGSGVAPVYAQPNDRDGAAQAARLRILLGRLLGPCSALTDLDYFKAFNDTYGHVAGDTCLQGVSRVVKKVAKRPGDLIARYGGEELAVVLSDTDINDATAIAETLRKEVQALSIPHEGSALTHKLVTVSAGVASMTPDRNSEPSEIVLQADAALYEAKRRGRNQVVVL